jgi:D-arginine dehydrogenase
VSESARFDAVVVGGGIAGATAAYHLSFDRRVALVEAEEAAGYHSSGRSAALWVANGGAEAERSLARESFAFLNNPPPGFAPDSPILVGRSAVYVAPEDQREALRMLLATRESIHELPLQDLHAMVPAIRPGVAAAAAIEFGRHDIDVDLLLQGYLRAARGRGAVVGFRRRTQRIGRAGGLWRVETSGGAVFEAKVLVNAAGAWGDEVAVQAGVRPLGLVPKRRTAVVIDPGPFEVAGWPRVYDAARSFYCKPEARTRLMVSPADATPTHAHDVQPEEIDIATAVARMQAVLDIPVRRVERAWAGLRTFTPDGAFAFGEGADGFFWFVGQGGEGILTSPAAGRLLADLVSGRAPDWLPGAERVVAAIDPRRFG